MDEYTSNWPTPLVSINIDLIIEPLLSKKIISACLISLGIEIDVNHIICHVKRIGGAFGGKESRSYVKYLIFSK